MSPEFPVATYRLQLHRDFDFEAARKAVPYLSELGVSHLYLSPIWAAAAGSMHGYDVVDHARVNEELGGIAGFYELSRTAREHGLGLVLDIVPNHVGISNHQWWRDVLRHGPRSPFAPYFDIDWQGQPEQATGVLVYPVLGQPFGGALESGELSLEYDGAEIVVRYYDRTFPVTPRCYREVLGLPPPEVVVGYEHEVVTILDGLKTAEPDAARLLLERLARCLADAPSLRSWFDERVRSLNGQTGAPETFDGLEALLRQQHYRLAYWPVSGEEVNYRRFFDINDLGAIRVEHEPVFEATHSLVREIVAAGLVSGLRVDHIDGLYDPGDYLRRLRDLVDDAATDRHWIWVEKIVARNESVPAHWPIDGTTGYDFLAIAGGLFIDPASVQPFTAIYHDFTGEPTTFADVAFAARRRVAGRSFAGEVNVLALQLYRLAQRRRLARDNTLGALREAIAGLLSSLPVYRTYLEHGEPMDADAELIRGAAADALHRDTNLTPESVAFLVQVLLLELGDDEAEERARWIHFRRRFQQLSGPVMAKGVEDTAFFRFHRMLACNEVGDDPARFGVPAAAAHDWFSEHATTWPRSLSTTTTHDTKRSEDARMRLAALTSVPRAWHREVRAWARMNARHHRTAGGQDVPDRNTEYYLYQTLIASWDGHPGEDYSGRIEAHMVKAAREAKLKTNWVRIDEGYEAALRQFVRTILDPRRSPAFVHRLDEFVSSIEPTARVNMLGLLALKVTAPGIPDFFQGSEFPLHTLTDPDNRQAVDFEQAQELFRDTIAGHPRPTDPRAKVWLTGRLLALRREHPGLYVHGAYRPVDSRGPAAANLFVFERHRAGERSVTALAHRSAQTFDSTGQFRSATEGITWVDLPTATGWTEWLTGRRFPGGAPVAASELLSEFPVAVLVADEGADNG